MSAGMLWLTILLVALGTFLERLSFIFLYGKIKLPRWLERALRFVPASVLAALVFPALTHPAGTLDLSFGNYHLLAGLVGALVAWRTRNVLLTLTAGMLALWIFQYLLVR